MSQSPIVRIALVSLAAVTLVTAVACSKKPKEETAPTTARDFNEGRTSPEPTGPQRSPDLKTVYFEFDRSDIREDQQPMLRGNGDAIQKHPDWKLVTIEGHTDERGTEEYNLALGDRRAMSAKTFLVNLGIASSKLTTVSLGKSQPAVAGHDEAAWARNRRAEFLYSK